MFISDVSYAATSSILNQTAVSNWYYFNMLYFWGVKAATPNPKNERDGVCGGGGGLKHD